MIEKHTRLIEITEKKLINGLEKAKNHATSKSGVCLSTEYINNKSKLEWKCDNLKHTTWFATTKNVLQNGSWCPECAKEKTSFLLKNHNGIKKAQEHALSKGGLCLCNEYVNNRTKLEWKCHNSQHVSWFSTYSNVVSNGKWCAQCAKDNFKGSKKLLSKGLKKAKEYAITQGGECLTEVRNYGQENLEWKCHSIQHNSWFALYNNVVNVNTWCPQCDSEKRHLSHGNGLHKAISHAIAKGGQCLSNEYSHLLKMKWKCHYIKHSFWFALYTHVLNNGSWCPQCNIDSKKLPDGLEKATDYAKSRLGKCLSINYLRTRDKLEWKCKDINHDSWFATYNNVVNNDHWCPECALSEAMISVQEFKVRKILNYLFKTDFIKTRKEKWNINPKTNRRLELDGYSEKLKIAFEFQGRQHYEENIFKGLNVKKKTALEME